MQPIQYAFQENHSRRVSSRFHFFIRANVEMGITDIAWLRHDSVKARFVGTAEDEGVEQCLVAILLTLCILVSLSLSLLFFLSRYI